MDNATIKMVRVAEGKNSILSHLYIGGLFVCYLLEDRLREEEIAGETAIPLGEFGLSLNHWAGMHAEYAKRFPAMHEGMVEITEIPNYQLVFFHIGNYHTQTAGCPLIGSYWQVVEGDYQVMGSEVAYRYVYPRLLKEIQHGNDRLVVVNRFLPHDWVQAP